MAHPYFAPYIAGSHPYYTPYSVSALGAAPVPEAGTVPGDMTRFFEGDVKQIALQAAQAIMSAANPADALAGQINTILVRREIYNAKSHAINLAYDRGLIRLETRDILQMETADEAVQATKRFGYAVTPTPYAPLFLIASPFLASADRAHYRDKRKKWRKRFIADQEMVWATVGELNRVAREYVDNEDNMNLNDRIRVLTEYVALVDEGGADAEVKVSLSAYQLAQQAPILLALYSYMRDVLKTAPGTEIPTYDVDVDVGKWVSWAGITVVAVAVLTAGRA